MGSFDNKKMLRFVITLATGSFGSNTVNQFGEITASTQGNQLTLEGFRATASVDKAGGIQANTLHAKIYGVSQNFLNQITTLRWQSLELSTRNEIEVYAIDGDQETLFFAGNMITAFANYNQQPAVFLEITAQAGYINQIKPVSPSSYSAPVDVATAMGTLASTMGYVLEPNGVQVMLPAGLYLDGTALEQTLSLAHQAGLGCFIDDGILAITASTLTPRGVGLVPEISAQTGLVGYPSFTDTGVTFQTLFNPAIVFGGQIQLVTSTPSSGPWFVTSLAHELSCELPGGPWFSTLNRMKMRFADG
jgi:hypothetical protein